MELRLNGGRWALDSYLRHGDCAADAARSTRTHAAGEWHVASTTFDGTTDARITSMVLSRAAAKWRSCRWRRTDIDRRAAEPRVVVQGPHPYRAHHAVGVEAGAVPPVPTQVIPIWPEGVPGRRADAGPERLIDGRVINIHDPSLTYYPPAPGTATGAAVIVVCGRRLRPPGDGQRSGRRDADPDPPRRRRVRAQVSARRTTGIPRRCRMCSARCGSVRSRAAEFGVRPDRIGLFGASAGGHLAASAAALVRCAGGTHRRADRCGLRAAGFRGACCIRS